MKEKLPVHLRFAISAKLVNLDIKPCEIKKIAHILVRFINQKDKDQDFFKIISNQILAQFLEDRNNKVEKTGEAILIKKNQETLIEAFVSNPETNEIAINIFDEDTLHKVAITISTNYQIKVNEEDSLILFRLINPYILYKKNDIAEHENSELYSLDLTLVKGLVEDIRLGGSLAIFAEALKNKSLTQANLGYATINSVTNRPLNKEYNPYSRILDKNGKLSISALLRIIHFGKINHENVFEQQNQISLPETYLGIAPAEKLTEFQDVTTELQIKPNPNSLRGYSATAVYTFVAKTKSQRDYTDKLLKTFTFAKSDEITNNDKELVIRYNAHRIKLDSFLTFLFSISLPWDKYIKYIATLIFQMKLNSLDLTELEPYYVRKGEIEGKVLTCNTENILGTMLAIKKEASTNPEESFRQICSGLHNLFFQGSLRNIFNMHSLYEISGLKTFPLYFLQPAPIAIQNPDINNAAKTPLIINCAAQNIIINREILNPNNEKNCRFHDANIFMKAGSLKEIQNGNKLSDDSDWDQVLLKAETASITPANVLEAEGMSELQVVQNISKIRVDNKNYEDYNKFQQTSLHLIDALAFSKNALQNFSGAEINFSSGDMHKTFKQLLSAEKKPFGSFGFWVLIGTKLLASAESSIAIKATRESVTTYCKSIYGNKELPSDIERFINNGIIYTLADLIQFADNCEKEILKFNQGLSARQDDDYLNNLDSLLQVIYLLINFAHIYSKPLSKEYLEYSEFSIYEELNNGNFLALSQTRIKKYIELYKFGYTAIEGALVSKKEEQPKLLTQPPKITEPEMRISKVKEPSKFDVLQEIVSGYTTEEFIIEDNDAILHIANPDERFYIKKSLETTFGIKIKLNKKTDQLTIQNIQNIRTFRTEDQLKNRFAEEYQSIKEKTEHERNREREYEERLKMEAELVSTSNKTKDATKKEDLQTTSPHVKPGLQKKKIKTRKKASNSSNGNTQAGNSNWRRWYDDETIENQAKEVINSTLPEEEINNNSSAITTNSADNITNDNNQNINYVVYKKESLPDPTNKKKKKPSNKKDPESPWRPWLTGKGTPQTKIFHSSLMANRKDSFNTNNTRNKAIFDLETDKFIPSAIQDIDFLGGLLQEWQVLRDNNSISDTDILIFTKAARIRLIRLMQALSAHTNLKTHHPTFLNSKNSVFKSLRNNLVYCVQDTPEKTYFQLLQKVTNPSFREALLELKEHGKFLFKKDDFERIVDKLNNDLKQSKKTVPSFTTIDAEICKIVKILVKAITDNKGCEVTIAYENLGLKGNEEFYVDRMEALYEIIFNIGNHFKCICEFYDIDWNKLTITCAKFNLNKEEYKFLRDCVIKRNIMGHEEDEVGLTADIGESLPIEIVAIKKVIHPLDIMDTASVGKSLLNHFNNKKLPEKNPKYPGTMFVNGNTTSKAEVKPNSDISNDDGKKRDSNPNEPPECFM